MMPDMNDAAHTSSAHDDAVPDPASSYRFAPIPLVSGNVVSDASGQHPIASITVTVTTADGRDIETPLHYHHGGWWVDPN